MKLAARFVSAVFLCTLAASSASAQGLYTDKPDYAPGEFALIVGLGFTPGESVTLQVLHADGTPDTGADHQPWVVVANPRGYVLANWHVCEDDCVGALLRATAVGATSGVQAEVYFTDDNPPCSSGTGVVTLAATGGSCLAETPPQGNGPHVFEVAQGGTYTMTISGVTECSGDTITVFVQNESTGNFCFNATGGGGTYVGSFTMADPACNTYPISYKCGADAPCDNQDTFNARGPGGACTVHLRASTFDANCAKTADDEDCAGGCVCDGVPVLNYCVGCDKLDAPPFGDCFPWFDLGCNPTTLPACDPGITASDACGPVPVICNFRITPPIGCVTIRGVTHRALNDCGEVICVAAYIWVEDTTQPTISCPPDVAVDCGASTFPTETGWATAVDGCDGKPTITFVDTDAPGACAGSHVISRTWTATDDCGNSTSCVQTITVSDTTGPAITCPPDVGLDCSASTDPASTGSAGASDDCSGVSDVSHVDSDAPGACAGSHVITRTWTATDGCGNSTSCVQTITVTDTTGPVISCPPSVQIDCAASSEPANTGSATAEDDCSGVASIGHSDVDAPGACAGSHVITRTWTATDNCGNSSSCVQTITVSDTTAPTISCPPNVKANGNGECCVALDIGQPTTSDDCSGVTVRSDAPAQFCVGDTLVTWTATDGCENASTCQQTVTVLGQICATKFYDANANGVQDDGEAGVEGWLIQISGSTSFQGTTDANGHFCVAVPVGTYSVSEGTPTETNWVATTATSIDVTIDAAHCSASASFGNYCFSSPSGGLTLGFWSNKNGQRILSQNDPAWRTLLNGLNLRNANGTSFDVPALGSFATAYAAFRTWILGATATNMSYMLSAQLAAATLASQFSGLDSAAHVIVPGGVRTGGNVCIVPH